MNNTPDSAQRRASGVGSGRMVRGVPQGCEHAPGFILDVFDGSAWLRADGSVTDKWKERGVWATEADARAALERFFSTNVRNEPRDE